jgi:polyisoprenoid-binding protein YceI
VASFTTPNTKRDDKVRSATLLDAAAHPTMSFHADSAERRDGAWILHGRLTVRGTTAPVDLVVSDVVTTPDRLTATATGRIDRTTVGVTAMKGMVGRYLDLTVSVNATV